MIPARPTSPSLARWRRRLLNEMYNVMCCCPAVKFDSCNISLSSFHTQKIIIIIIITDEVICNNLHFMSQIGILILPHFSLPIACQSVFECILLQLSKQLDNSNKILRQLLLQQSFSVN